MSPAASLILSLIPEGTFTTLLNNMKGVDEPNRKRLAELEQKGDWNGIAQFAQENIAVDPTNPDWRVVAGYAYSQLGQYERAADQFQHAVRASPDDITAWNLLAQSYRSMGQPERAIRTLDNALRINQDSPVTYYLLGASFNDLKRPDRAVAFYEQAIQRNPRFAEALYDAGLAYAQLGRRSELEYTVQRLRPVNPALADRLAKVQVAPPPAPATAGGVPELPTERRRPK
ncbi:MAG TPA: tetratricopeptide repeat protein [Burkholderiales bacterium]|nr:tetratricopeptide repeat protein [Burkholderiales bacterium]